MLRINRAGGDGADRDRTIAPFRHGAVAAECLQDGPLTLAWAPARERSLYVSDRTVCLVEGALYEPQGDGTGAQRVAARWEANGQAALANARGEYWAFVWDRRSHRGMLAADHLGCRAPYWFRSGTELVAASEVAELLDALPTRPEPDPLALAHWLMATAQPRGRTLFAGLRRLEAGHVLALGPDLEEPSRYWTPRYRRPVNGTDELAHDLRSALARGVSRRLADGLPAGVLLSGGLDSSVVAALASSERDDLNAYSAVFPLHPAVDESALIDQTTIALGLRSTRIVVRGGSVIAGALGYLRAWELPPTSPNLFFWTPLLERAAAEGTLVMLDGEGGDELFGLSPYLIADRLRRGRLRSAVGLARRWPSASPVSRRELIWLLRSFGVRGALPPAAHLLARRLRPLDSYAGSWLAPGLAGEWLASEESAFAFKRLPGPRWWSYLAHAITRGIGPALVYEQSRRRAALAGLDARHPLVDVDVVEQVLSSPPEAAFDPRFSRPLLRASVAGLLPEEVRLRPGKSAFDALFHAALAGPDLPLVRKLLSGGDAELRRYVDLDLVRRTLLDPEPPAAGAARQEWAIRTWRLLTAECWLRSQRDPEFPAALREREQLDEPRHELRTTASGAGADQV